MRQLARHSRFAMIIAVLAGFAVGLSESEFAQTSSWTSTTDPAVPKPPGAATTKTVPTPKGAKTPPRSGDPLSRFQKGPIGAPAPRSEPAPSGDDAAFLAFDQGQYLTALTIAGKRAEQGDAAACTLVGRIYDEGLGVNRDEVIAARWYAQGAKLGDVESAFALGVMMAEGRGVEKDRVAA